MPGFRSLFFALLVLMLAGCAGLPDNRQQQTSYQYPEAVVAETPLGQGFDHYRQTDQSDSGFRLLSDGLDAFVARIAMIRAAEKSIDAQYYLLHDDLTGRLFLNELIKAAERGVRVRLLVDDMDFSGREFSAAALNAQPGMQVRIFNPFGRHTSRWPQFISRFGKVTRRMHNKAFVADSQVAILGGRNIGDAYFAADPALAFGDLDLLGVGPVARQAGASFDAYWNHRLAYDAGALYGKPVTETALKRYRQQLRASITGGTSEDGLRADSYYQALQQSELAQSLLKGDLTLIWGQAEIVADDPEKLVADRQRTELHLSQALAPYFDQLEQSLTIFSPYFVPGEAGTEFLTALVNKGIRVRVLTNSLASTDVALVHVGYARYRKALLKGGVELYEMKHQPDLRSDGPARRFFSGSSKASLHAKSFVLDRRQVFIGSLNLDPRSLVENSEVGVVIQAPDIAVSMTDWFETGIDQVAFRVRYDKEADALRWLGQDKGQQTVFEQEPYTGFWQRFTLDLMRLLPIESQL